MIYRSRKGRKKNAVKITREDIEKAMLEFKGEIKYLKIEKGPLTTSLDKNGKPLKY